MKRHFALDGLRGLAALLVALYHFLHFGAGITVQSMGTFTVYLFFALSGLTIAMVYGQQFSDRIMRDDLSRFYRARLARIMPLLVLVSLIYATISPGEIWHAILAGSGLFALSLPGLLSPGTGIWSLGIEIAFYIVFPLIALIIGRWTRPAVVVLVLATAAAAQIYIASISAFDAARFWQAYVVPLTFAPFFAVGLLVHRCSPSLGPLWAAPALASLVGLSCASLVLGNDLLLKPAAYLLLMLATAATLFCAWRATLSPLAERIAQFLGEISYSLYLTHWLVFLVVSRVGLSLPTAAAAFFGGAIVLAWLTSRWFEQPVQAAIMGKWRPYARRNAYAARTP